MGEKSCLIVFKSERKGIEITFVGNWIRADVDRAYSAMFGELPKHFVKVRKELEESKKSIEKEEEND